MGTRVRYGSPATRGLTEAWRRPGGSGEGGNGVYSIATCSIVVDATPLHPTHRPIAAVSQIPVPFTPPHPHFHLPTCAAMCPPTPFKHHSPHRYLPTCAAMVHGLTSLTRMSGSRHPAALSTSRCTVNGEKSPGSCR